MAQEQNRNDVEQPLTAPPTPSSPSVRYYRSIFDRADTDGDGFINISELNRMIATGDLTDDPIPPSLVNRIHQISDTNHDGRLEYDEFVEMINNPQFQGIFGKYVNKYVHFIVPRKQLGADVVDLEYADEYSCSPPKLCMIIISLIEIVFFLIDELCEKDSTKLATGPMAKALIYDPAKRYEAWRFLTYMFVHIGHLHLIVNLVVQIFVGIPLEMVHGWWRLLVIYSAGVVAGSLGTSITDPFAKLAGASGGVYSLITAHIATIILNWKEMTFPAVQLAIFLSITIADVGTSIYNRYYGKLEEHIGYAAHFAGAVAGLLVGISVLRNLRWTKKETVIWWISATVYVALMLVAILWNIFNPDHFPHQV